MCDQSVGYGRCAGRALKLASGVIRQDGVFLEEKNSLAGIAIALNTELLFMIQHCFAYLLGSASTRKVDSSPVWYGRYSSTRHTDLVTMQVHGC